MAGIVKNIRSLTRHTNLFRVLPARSYCAVTALIQTNRFQQPLSVNNTLFSPIQVIMQQ